MASEHIKCDKNFLDLGLLVKAKKPAKRETRYYTEEQTKLFEKGIRKYFEHKPVYIVSFILLLRTGILVGELTGLQWDNANLDGSIAVLNGRMSKQLDGTHQYEDGLKNGITSFL